MKIYFLLITSLIFLNFSCNYKETGRGKKGVISIDPFAKDEVNFDDMFSKIEIFPLQSTNKALINIANKFIIDNFLYVLDKKQKALIIFDKEGMFIRKIQHIGKGPGEYQDISDFTIDKQHNTISLLTPQGIIFQYNTLGEFKSQFRPSNKIVAAHYFEYIDSSTMAIYNHFDNKKLKIVDLNKKEIIYESLEERNFVNLNDVQIIDGKSPFAKIKTKLYLHSFSSESISMVNKGGLKEFINFDFGNNHSDVSGIEKHQNLKNTFILKDLKSYTEKYPFFFNYAISDKDIFVSYTYKGARRSFLYNIQQKRYKPCSRFTQGVQPRVDLIENGFAYSLVSPENISYVLNDKILDKNNRQKLEKIKSADNLILVKYSIK